MTDKTRMTQAESIEAIRRAVYAIYIETGKPARYDAIGKWIGCTGDSVRRVINAAHGFIPGIESVQVEVPRYSKSYRMYQVGTSLATAYEPTKAMLVESIKNITARAS